MKRLKMFAALSLTVGLVSSCVTLPKTPVEFRAAMNEKYAEDIQTVIIKRPLAAVVKSMDALGKNCLRQKITQTTHDPQTNTNRTMTTDFELTVVKAKKSAELHYQQRYTPTPLGMGDMPEKGAFMLIADISGKNKNTEVKVYTASYLKPVVSAIERWGNGNHEGCPDMSQVGPSFSDLF